MVVSTNNKRTKPKYRIIQDILTSEIRNGQFQPNDHFSTLDRICERFGTSKITAQRAFMEMVRNGMLYTKRGCGAYIAPPRRKNESRLFGCLFDTMIEDGALPLVIRGAENAAREHGYNVLLCSTQRDHKLARTHIARMLEQKIDGVLYDFLLDEEFDSIVHDVLDRFESAGVPVVLVQRRLLNDTRPVSYVIPDNYGGTVQAVEHLCRLGHRRIAGIYESTNSSAIERCEGCKGAVLKCGAVFHQDLIKTITVMEDCDTAIAQLLAMEQRPTAIMCEHDLIARHVMMLLRGHGLRIPDDMAIIGFDDLPFSKYLQPPLTTVRQPLEQIGREAVNILIRRITGNFNDHAQIRLGTKLVVRQSCGAPAAEAPATMAASAASARCA